jgi:hypothetical protein
MQDQVRKRLKDSGQCKIIVKACKEIRDSLCNHRGRRKVFKATPGQRKANWANQVLAEAAARGRHEEKKDKTDSKAGQTGAVASRNQGARLHVILRERGLATERDIDYGSQMTASHLVKKRPKLRSNSWFLTVGLMEITAYPLEPKLDVSGACISVSQYRLQ